MLKFNKSTRLALAAMLEVARAGGGPVSSTEIAERRGVSRHHLAKVLQQLVRAGFLVTARGVKGGHTLGRDAREVTLRDVVEAFEPSAAAVEEADPALQSVFEELDEQVAATLDSISLRTLVSRSVRRT
jgi:Rrf2 family protein